MSKVFISVGSNLGDRSSYISLSINELKAHPSIKDIKKSSLMETEPVGVKDQQYYINQILIVSTTLMPKDLLYILKSIEQRLGRVKRAPWAEREIDLDIIAYDDQSVITDELSVPHRELMNRAFILKGCTELMPSYVVPLYEKTVLTLYNELKAEVSSQKIRVLAP